MFYDLCNCFSRANTANKHKHYATSNHRQMAKEKHCVSLYTAGPIKKAFWGIIVFLTVGALMYNMWAITSLYADYPVTVSITLLHETELVFPAITICNMSPVRKSSMENSSAVQDALDRKRRKRRRRKRAAGNCSRFSTKAARFSEINYLSNIPH